ncbi:MAG: hypothetical protein ACJAR2_000470 [Ilumatobacter sp.]|jgi:hypothetical protein
MDGAGCIGNGPFGPQIDLLANIDSIVGEFRPNCFPPAELW